MEPYFFFFICAIFVVAIIISCVLRCRVIARRRREARERLDTRNEYNLSLAPGSANTEAVNMAYYYGQSSYGGPADVGAGAVYDGRQILRQPGQAVLPATVLLSSTGNVDSGADDVAARLFPQARVVDAGANAGGGHGSNPYGQTGASANYVPPNSVFYDRDMHRDTNAEEVYGAATYLPRPPADPGTPLAAATTCVRVNSPKAPCDAKDAFSSDSSTR